MTPAKLAYVVVFATALALATVRQSNLRLRTGYHLHDLRARIAEQQAERTVYRTQLSKLRNPQRILRLVAWLGLNLQERADRTVVAESADGTEGVAMSVDTTDDLGAVDGATLVDATEPGI